VAFALSLELIAESSRCWGSIPELNPVAQSNPGGVSTAKMVDGWPARFVPTRPGVASQIPCHTATS
jgi:hypothetical protein